MRSYYEDIRPSLRTFNLSMGTRADFLGVQCLNCNRTEEPVVDPSHLDECEGCGATSNQMRPFASELKACRSCGEPIEGERFGPQEDGPQEDLCRPCSDDEVLDGMAYRMRRFGW